MQCQFSVPAGSKGCPVEGRAMCMKVNMSVTVESVSIVNMNVMEGFRTGATV